MAEAPRVNCLAFWAGRAYTPRMFHRRKKTDAPPGTPKRSRRWFLKGLVGAGGLTAAGFGVDWLLPRTLCRPGEWNGPVSDHFNGTFFYNPEPHTPYTSGNLIDWCRDRFYKGDYPVVEERRFTPQPAKAVDGRNWEATLVNHSTFLLRMAGMNILTDPVWSDYTSPVQGFGPKRCRPVGITWEELPRIDICLLSHDHYDHFDVATLQRLRERDNPLFIVPLGLKSLLEYHCGSCRVEEHDWWGTLSVGKLRITLTPARHWSSRYRTQDSRNRSLWCGFWLESPGGPKVYFAGDSARSTCFERIRKRLGAPHVAILPIGQYRPGWIRQNHTSPADAVEAFLTLRARMGIACHFGTWQLANEGYQDTLDDLADALRANGVDPALFPAPDNGQTLRG